MIRELLSRLRRPVIEPTPLREVPRESPPTPARFVLTRAEHLELENLSLKKEVLVLQGHDLDLQYEYVKQTIRQRLGVSNDIVLEFEKGFSQVIVRPAQKGGSQ